MTPVDLFGLVLLGSAASLGLAVLAGCLLAFGEERLEIEADELAERLMRRPGGLASAQARARRPRYSRGDPTGDGVSG